jgi:hypothetical protein
VTVIEARVHRNSMRNARLGFVVTAIAVTALGMVVATQWLQPTLALLCGVLAGLVAGGVVWCAVRSWPVVRVVWWWLGELLACVAVVYGWNQLNRLPLTAVALVTATLLASLLASPVRRVVVAWVWCFIVRHRLRTCFAQFIVANRSGSLPLILVARPTPVGERVWIYLRPGLSPSDLESRLERIAVACHASSVLVERASTRTAAFVRVDVKRREVLGGLVGSPLASADADTDDSVPVSPAPASAAVWAVPDVDLPGVSAASASSAASPATTARLSAVVTPTKKVPPVVSDGEDLSDWID